MTTAKEIRADLFGAVQMGYAVIESRRLDAWRRFLKQGLGLHLESADDRELAFRIDERARRLIVRDGAAEDFVALGYQLRDRAALDIVLARLAARGIAVEAGSDADAAARGVRALWRLKGPKALAIELFVEPVISDAPLQMLCSGFVTGDSGMGHVALTSRQPDKVLRFWQEIFDARLSDRISQKLAGVVLDISFLRLNERHHSVAIAATRGLRLDPIRTKVQHLNLLCNTRDDLDSACERLRALGHEMAHEIGQHPNDREVSFYVLTPSGFEIELGCEALKVDESSWQGGHYDAISLWGHQPQNASRLNQLAVNAGNALRGLRSRLAPEYSPF